MDLIERGRSLGELGRTLRWSDIHAMLLHLPPTSHVKRMLSPEIAKEHEWTTPTVQMLAALFDQQARENLLRRGVEPEQLPVKGILSHVLESDGNKEAGGEAKVPERSSTTSNRDKKAREAAARIRAGL